MFLAEATHLDAPVEHLVRLVRPLFPGLSIGHPAGSVGSLGGFATLREQPSTVGLLSSATVLWPAGAAVGDYIHQPGPIDNPLFTGESRVARIIENIKLSRSRQWSVDAAFAEFQKPSGLERNVVPRGFPDSGMALLPPGGPALRVGDLVAKIGRGTGQTRGRVVALNADRTVHALHRSRAWSGDSAQVQDLIEIEGEAGPFSGPGDSGAAVYRVIDGQAVGLLFASSREQGGPALSFAHPLGRVLDALGLDWL